jgi:simple sugar transport system ATP-binding protein
MGIEFDMSRTVGDMSIAEHQLIAIGRALIQDPRLIIMDEPTAALSQREVDRLFGIIRSLQKDGISVLFVSHKLGEVLEISETITVLRNGTNAAEGKREDFDQKSLAHAMTGRIPRIREYRQQPVSSGAQGILEVEDLSRKGGFRNVSFQLHSGEVVGITGLLGSGRTELARSLFGIDPADSGAIRIDGLPVAIRRVADALRCGIAYVPEDRLGEGLFLDQSVERNLVVGILDSLRGFAGLLSPARIRDRAESWIDRFAINTPDPGSAVRNLSGGNQQKTVLARWMATEARILILNGPTMGVDVAAKADILDRVVSLADAGMAVLILSDDLPELVHTCSRIFLMHRGCLIEEFAEGNFDAEILAHKLTALR